MSSPGETIHEPLTHANRPHCEKCEREMWLVTIRIVDFGLERRTYECAGCHQNQTLLCKPRPARISTIESPSIDPAKQLQDHPGNANPDVSNPA